MRPDSRPSCSAAWTPCARLVGAVAEQGLRCVPGEGLGNTFLLAREEDAARTGLAPGELAQRACGAQWDGLLLLGPAQAPGRRLGIYNRDGSDGGVCLNGLRAAALWEGAAGGEFCMAGRAIRWRRVPEGVELHLRRADLPQELALEAVALDGLTGVSVPFWNPHCVVPVADLGRLNLQALARAVAARRDLFPQGVNVEAIADGGPGLLRARVWERGVGETRACGSGAVAVALAAWAGGAQGPLRVEMPGGVLSLAPAPDGGVLLRGAASIGKPMDLALD
ncbi:MAG: hypothetical protein EYC70_00690 [Planctomycetota bacterium]|nr:MAG: hypothetical protein EYC70_00690 [Planctomycetota bacterium]